MLDNDVWNYLNPIVTCGNIAQSGAVLAIAIKVHDQKMKQVAYPSALSAALGITEPAVFGVNLRLVKPFIAAMIGGGVGVPPLYETAKQYLSKDARVTVVLGANDAGSVFYVDEFKALGCDVYVATMDGSLGTKGTALDAIKENNVTCPFVLSCGPLPMLKAINEQYSEGYISLEARMACGLGACMGRVVKDVEGHSLRVCKDGPVFEMGKVAL